MDYYFELECADKGLQLLQISDAAEQVELPTCLIYQCKLEEGGMYPFWY